MIEQTYPSGRIVRNFLDVDGGLSSTNTKTVGGLLKQMASGFDYGSDGSIKKMKLGNGLWETTQYNHMSQLMQVGLGTTATNNDLFKIDYEFGELNSDGVTVDGSKNIGMIAKTTTTIPSTNFVQTFKYDAINRLTEAKETVATAQSWKQTFDYDRYGNRTGFTQHIGTVETINTAINHPTIDASNNRFTTGQGYVYDLNGNLIEDAEGRKFTFNGDDKQVEVKNSSNQTVGQYYYDGSGARVKKVSNTETVIFVYDAGGALAAEYSTPDSESKISPATSYLTTDHLGSPRVITDGEGEVVSRRDFMPFGEEIYVGVGGRTAGMKYALTTADHVRQRFTGYEKDEETDLDFAQARMYQNRHGRFTAPDPLLASADGANPQTFNRYTYTGNNPINYTDPSGLTFCQNTSTGSISWNGKDGRACADGSKSVDGQTITLATGSGLDSLGNRISNGSTVKFGKDGKAYVIDPASGKLAGHAALDQSQSVLGGTNDVASKNADESFKGSGEGGGSDPSGGTTGGGVCSPGAIGCDGPTTHAPSLDTSNNEPLKTVAAIEAATELLTFIPVANVPATAMLMILKGFRGDSSGALSESVGFLPGGKLLKKLDKIADGGRLGNAATRSQIDNIASTLESRGYKITGGGGRRSEEYLRPIGGGRRGGSYVDITAVSPNGKTLRINTVDTLKNGKTPNSRERTNAKRIRKQRPGEHLLLIPKMR